MNTILLFAGLAALGYVVGKLVIKKDTAIEDRRRRAIQLASWSASNGLPLVSRLLVSYSVGDYSSLRTQIGEVATLLADDAEAKGAVNRFLEVQLDKRLSTAEGRDEIVTLIEKKLNLKIDRAALIPAPVEVGVPKE